MEPNCVKCCDYGKSDGSGEEAAPISRWMKTRNERIETNGEQNGGKEIQDRKDRYEDERNDSMRREKRQINIVF